MAPITRRRFLAATVAVATTATVPFAAPEAAARRRGDLDAGWGAEWSITPWDADGRDGAV